MKNCSKCGSLMEDNAIFCTACGAKEEAPVNNQPPQFNPQQGTVPPQNQGFAPQNDNWQPAGGGVVTDNRRLYCILSYIGILWLFGLLVAPEKFDKRVRFNVGQGIIASIVSAGVNLVVFIITSIISAIFPKTLTVDSWGGVSYEQPIVAVIFNSIFWLAASAVSIFFLVYGIMKVCKNQDTYLPFIGRFSFYK